MAVDSRVLLRPFDPSLYEYDANGYVYVPGRLVQQRLTSACETDWGIVSAEWSQFKMPASSSGKLCLGLEVTLALRIGDGGPYLGSGQGNWYEGTDRDTVKRGALTAAIRSAASFAGVGLELYAESAIDHWIDWLDMFDGAPEAVWLDAKALLSRVEKWRDGPRASHDHKEVWKQGAGYVLDRIKHGIDPTVAWSRADAPEIEVSASPRDTDQDERPRQQGGGNRDLKEVVVTGDGINWNGPEPLAPGRKGKCFYCEQWLAEGEMKFWAKNPDTSSQYKFVVAHATCVDDRVGGQSRSPEQAPRSAPQGGGFDRDDEDPFGDE